MKKSILVITVFCLLIVFPLLGLAEDGPVRTSEMSSASAMDVSGSLLKVTIGLLFVVVAIFGSAWFLRRFGNVSTVPSQSLRIIGGLNIGSREKVLLLQVGEQQVLIGVTSSSIQPLHVLEKPVSVTGSETVSESFSVKLNQAIKQWKAK